MNQFNAYKQASVNTASPGKLLIMLFDGLMRFMDQSVAAIDEGNVEQAHWSLLRAQDIVLELRSTLESDQAPELAENLHSLYTFFYEKLVDANRSKESSNVTEIRPMVESLRDAFAQAEAQSASERQE